MKKICLSIIILSIMGAPMPAYAGDNPKSFAVGMQTDLSVPSGAALGMNVRLPHVPWFKLGLSGTYALAPGIRGNLLIDPIKFPIAPVGNVDFGHQFPFKVPTLNDSPSVDFTYCDLNAGLGLGNRDGFRFLIMSGMSYIYGSAHNSQYILSSNAPRGFSVGDPTFNGWVPNFKLGFSLLF